MIPNNLPPLLTSIVGRVSELNEIADLLSAPEVRMIVLTGLAGSGKTRLALEAAHRQVQERTFPDGVWRLALEDLRDPACLAGVFAAGLKLGFQEQSDTRGQLLQFLETKRMLLLLDNVEQLAGKTTLIAEVLTAAPAVRILATSIEPVDLNGVRTVRIGGLRLQIPGGDESTLPDAMHLFIQRARRAKPTFRLASEDLPHAHRICELVDGLPAGIDLATIWIRMLSCSEIVAELEHSLDFLKTSFRNMHPRHHSLREIFDYSWRRLGAGDQQLFRDLAVFTGGCRLDAAATVLGVDEQRLAALSDRSLLAQTGNGRYIQPGLLRQYALEQLTAMPAEAAMMQENYANYYRRFLVEHTPTRYKHGSQEALNDLDAERENIRAAWEWAVAGSRLPEIDQSITGLDYYYTTKGWYAEAADLFERAVRAVDQSTAQGADEVLRLRGKLLIQQGFFMYKQGYLEGAETLLHESASLLGSVGAAEDLVDTLFHLGGIISQRGDFARAREYQQESLELARHTGNHFAEINCLNALGLTSLKLGEYDQARNLYAQSLDLARSANDPGVLANSLNDFGYMLSRIGSAGEAIPYLNEALNLARSLHNRRLVTYVLATLGEATYAAGDFAQSKRYSAESLERAEKQNDQVLVTHLLIR